MDGKGKATMIGEWFERAFDHLPRSGDPAFQQLWAEGRLRFQTASRTADIFDRWSAGLVCAAITRKSRLLIILPDSLPHRPPMLFATALIMHAVDGLNGTRNGSFCTSTTSRRRSSVLYFGSSVGIREQTKQVRVQGGLSLNLADVFTQTTAIGNQGRAPPSSLPVVHCIYAPADPIGVIQEVNPPWVAVDCGERNSLPWLGEVLSYARKRDLPVIAWATNPLSESCDLFRSHGRVFGWPCPPSPNIPAASASCSDVIRLFSPGVTCAVRPAPIESDHANAISAACHAATEILIHLTGQSGQDRLLKDAVMLHWSLLRAIESLCVPFELFEVEAPRVWGMRSIGHLRAACARFSGAISNKTLASALERTQAAFDDATEIFRRADPPLWGAILQLCDAARGANETAALVLPTAGRRELVVTSLLARHNLAPDDLRRRGVYILDLAELQLLASGAGAPYAGPLTENGRMSIGTLIHVGLPSPSVYWRLQSLLSQPKVDVLLLPHQLSALRARVTNLGSKLQVNLMENTEILATLSGSRCQEDAPALADRVRLTQSSQLKVLSGMANGSAEPRQLWEPSNAAEEVAKLFGEAEDGLADPPSDLAPSSTLLDDQPIAEEMTAWTESAVEIRFEGGWSGLFAEDDELQVIVPLSNGSGLQHRFVRSLRAGQRVVIIHGQRPQSLYDLVISRVHQHPAIEIHLALVRRWQSELAAAFRRWRNQTGSDVDGLLRALQDAGSDRTCALTLHQWLRGDTLCPIDGKDLVRLASILQMDFVARYHTRIEQAASRLRGLHRGLAHRLNHWLDDRVTGALQTCADDVIDAELGLTFSDIRSSLLVLKVLSVTLRPGLYRRDSLGRVERNNNDTN